MTAIFTGPGAGFLRGSATTLGSAGSLGSAATARGAGDNLMVNAATGNLVITRQDEFFSGPSQDLGISRTYNSLAEVGDGDNNDKWQMSTVRTVFGLVNPVNTVGSTVKRQAGDGSVVTYAWGTRNGVAAYWTTDGDGAHDKLLYSAGLWTWTDGASQFTEIYEGAFTGTWRLLRISDTSGNQLNFTYLSASDLRLDKVTAANGEYVKYAWTGNLIDRIDTGLADRVVTRTYYYYDPANQNRLASVKVDLSPDAAGIADNHAYVLAYEYGTNKLVTAVVQKSGTGVETARTDIVYDGAGRVLSLTERASPTENRVTSFVYGPSWTEVTAPDGQMTRLEYSGTHLAPDAISRWGSFGAVREPAAAIDGMEAEKVTGAVGSAGTGLGSQITVAAGDKVTFAVSLMAVAGYSTTQSMMTFSVNDGGVPGGNQIGRIVSGPGSLYQRADGNWEISGLSTTQATRVEILRTITNSGFYGAYVFVDEPGGNRDGHQLIIAGASVTKSNNITPSAIYDWGYGGAYREAAGSIGGETAAKYTSNGTGWAGISTGFIAYGTGGGGGSTYKFTASLMAVAGSSTDQSLGIYGAATGWGDARQSSARIISGPGQIQHWSSTDGALWRVTGLSTTEATKIEIIRTFAAKENSAGAYIYVDHPNGYRNGQQLIIAGPTLEQMSETPVTLATAMEWGIDGVSRTADGTLNGKPAVRLTTNETDWSGTYDPVGFLARPGESYRYHLNLQAVAGSSTEQSFGLYGNLSGWGASNLTHARIISGPGTIVQNATYGSGALWKVTGLSTTTPTQIEIVRTYDREEYGRAYLYVRIDGGFQMGQQVLFSGPAVAKINDYAPSERQLTRIISPAAYAGAAQQIQTFDYDADGNLIRSTAPNGAVTKYSYDAMGNLTLIDNPVGTDVTRSYDAGNRVKLEQSNGSEEGYDPVPHYTRYAYSTAGLLRYRVGPDGRVTEYAYDIYARLSTEIEYLFDYYPVAATAITETDLTNWRNGLSDKTQKHVKTITYDARGNVIYTYDYATATSSGNPSPDEGYTYTAFTYDHLGRLLSTNRYAEGPETYAYDGLNRVVASSNPASGVTSVFFEDAALRTVMHFSSGLNRTLTYNKAGDLIGEVESAIGSISAPEATDLNAYSTERLTRTTDTPIGGQPAYKYEVTQAGPYGAIWSPQYSVQGGETFRFRFTMKKSGTASLHAFGLYVLGDWGSNLSTDAQAVIVSGPGRLSQNQGGLWQLEGMSSTTETIVEVLRTFTQSQTVGVGFYVGGPGNVAAGTALILSTPSIVRTVPDASLAIAATTSNSYDKLGRLRVSYDEFDNGNRTYFLYDNAGRKTAEINDYGHMTEFLYDVNNRLIGTVKYANGVAGSYFDNASETNDLRNPNNNLTAAQIRPGTHVYDLRDWTIYDVGGRVVQTIDGTGAVTAYEYDSKSRLVRATTYANRVSTTGLIATAPTSPVAVTPNSAADAVTRTFYNRDGLVRGTLDGEGYLVEYVYDAAGRKTEEIRYGAAITDPNIKANGSLATVRGYAGPANPDVRRTRFVYDSRGLLRYQINNLSQVTGFTYNLAGRLTETRVYFNPISVANYKFATVKAAATTHANDRVTTLTLDAAGRVVMSQDPAGTATYSTYDPAGQLVKVRHGSNAATEQITRNWYDARGDLRYSVDPAGFLRKYVYTVGGRLSYEYLFDDAVSVSDTTTIAQVRDLATAAQNAGTYTRKEFLYDNLGRLSREYDGTGAFTIYARYATGLLSEVYAGYDSGSGTNDRSTTLYAYDAAGHQTYQWDAYGETEQVARSFGYNALGLQNLAVDGRGVHTVTSYDRRGARIQVVENATGTSRTTDFQLNAFGEVVKATDPKGGKVFSYYDTLGRVTLTAEQYDTVGGVEKYYLTQTTYTAFGEVETVKRFANTYSGTPSVSTAPSVSAHANDATTGFEYDKMSRVKKITDAMGFYETFTYNEVGDRITKVAKSNTSTIAAGGTTTYTYDRRGLKLTEVLPMSSVGTDGNLVTNTITGQPATTVTNKFEYDSRGNLRFETKAYGLPEQVVTEFKYDRANRLIERIDPTFHTSLTPHTYFYYDARGNLTSRIEPGNAKTVYFYDDLGRVVIEINAAGTYTGYAYDANGNVTSIKVYETPASMPADGGSQEEALSGLAPPPSGNFRETTFVYDNFNRMTSSSVLGVTTGSYDGSTWSTTTGALLTQYEYDRNDNVVKTIDPNLMSTWAWYDAANRKIEQVDSLGYRTRWAYDAESNVTQEYRYFNPGSYPAAGSPPPLPALPTPHSKDRITDYTYDRMGNRLSETRLNVEVHNGSAPGSYTTVSARIDYLYNGLGQVTRKTEAATDAGIRDQVNYTYDSAGRLTQETKATFTDHNGVGVTPTVEYRYNGLGNLIRTREVGYTYQDDRVTTYGYEGGKLRWMADAAYNYGAPSDGKQTWYWYDIAGNLQYEYYARSDSTGALAGGNDLEGILRVYDGLGRVTQQWHTFNPIGPTDWTTSGPVTYTAYNAFGEVKSIQVGTGALQHNQYDNAGRLIGSNAGDGVWKYFAYDKNGNQTGAVTSAGTNLTGSNFAAARTLSGVAVTYTRYDARNMARFVDEPGRELTASTSQTLVTERQYNAFGEVAWEKGANNAQIDYTYNTMGRLIKVESPTVNVTSETGAVSSIRPTEQMYYDAAGRLVAQRDANNNLTRLTLLAGTGYGGSQALVTHETHADNGVKQTKYDIHGDARVLLDEVGGQIQQAFDQMGRVVNTYNVGAGLYNYYEYDGLGQQLRHYNGVYGSGDAETTDYDVQGRVISQRSFGGDMTTTSYVWDNTLASGVGTFGGWVTTVSTDSDAINTVASINRNDLFGRLLSFRDKSGINYTNTYDIAGRMTASGSVAYTYYNTGLVKSKAWSLSGYPDQVGNPTYEESKTVSFTYDVMGRLKTESLNHSILVLTGYDPNYPQWPVPIYDSSSATQDTSVDYDALGRVTRYRDGVSQGTPDVDKNWTYDANGNVRSIVTTYKPMNSNGSLSTGTVQSSYWYLYDSMNRVTRSKGTLSGSSIIHTGETIDVSYDAAGRRMTSYTGSSSVETYGYGANNLVTSVTIGGVQRVTSSYDALGRLIGHLEVNASGGVMYERYDFVYNSRNQVLKERGRQKQGADILYTHTANYYTDSGWVATSGTPGAISSTGTTGTSSGELLHYSETKNWINGSNPPFYGTPGNYSSADLNYADSYSKFGYSWADPTGAGQVKQYYHNLTNRDGQSSSASYYDLEGNITQVIRLEQSGTRNEGDIRFYTDASGQVIRRTEYNGGAAVLPVSRTYRFGGREMGTLSNDGTDNVDYVTTIDRRDDTGTGYFRGGATSGTVFADFDANHRTLAGGAQGGGPGSYTVQAGDTLQAIALGLWGDAGLWYKLAEANGLSGGGSLAVGRRLIIPNSVSNNHHNAGTLKPVGSSRVDLQACKLEYSIVSPK